MRMLGFAVDRVGVSFMGFHNPYYACLQKCVPSIIRSGDQVTRIYVHRSDSDAPPQPGPAFPCALDARLDSTNLDFL
jgi:hypothetical protein